VLRACERSQQTLHSSLCHDINEKPQALQLSLVLEEKQTCLTYLRLVESSSVVQPRVAGDHDGSSCPRVVRQRVHDRETSIHLSVGGVGVVMTSAVAACLRLRNCFVVLLFVHLDRPVLVVVERSNETWVRSCCCHCDGVRTQSDCLVIQDLEPAAVAGVIHDERVDGVRL